MNKLAKNPLQVDKPWGEFTQYTHNEQSTVKILTVNPGEKLSLQSHNKREELWVALDDNVIVEINGNTLTLKKEEQAFIPLGAKHRLSSNIDSANPVRVLEISYGEFDEDDIIRYEDNYGRVK